MFPKKQTDIQEIQAILKENETGIRLINLGGEVNSGPTHSPVLDLSGNKLYFALKTEIALNNLVFKPDSDELEAKSMPELNRLIEILNSEPSMRIEIQGHTSGKGRGDAFNLTLSTNRAIFVQKHLISQGIDANRLGAKGFGSEKPIYPNTTEANRKKNRRVTFVIVP